MVRLPLTRMVWFPTMTWAPARTVRLRGIVGLMGAIVRSGSMPYYRDVGVVVGAGNRARHAKGPFVVLLQSLSRGKPGRGLRMDGNRENAQESDYQVSVPGCPQGVSPH